MSKDNNNYDDLENQIGDAGAVENESKTLGKVSNKALGGKGELDEDEEKSRKAFEAIANKKHKIAVENKNKAQELSIAGGWVPVNRDEMGIRSIFYPSDWDFYIKPAGVSQIKNWVAIDETRADQVNQVLNEICRACVKIDTHDPLQGAGWAQINSWDRFWFILKVREATFTKGEVNIEFQDECSECGEDITYKLTSDSLFYDFPDGDLIEKYWDGKVWNINPQEYDVDHDPITLYTPKLGKDQAIIDWATAKTRAGGKIDEPFINYLMWMLPKPLKDAQMMDRKVDAIYKEYKSWSVEMLEFMSDVIRNITVNPSEQLQTTCPICGATSRSNVRFPQGIKQLFVSNTKPIKKFGSK